MSALARGAHQSPKSGLSRAEAYARILSLLPEGMTHAQIAHELCVSRSYVRDILQDPDGSKARARKQRLRRPCVDCGEPCWYERCEACSRVAQAAYWTDERVLEAAREWKRRYGEWPTTREWRRTQVVDGYYFPAFSACYFAYGDDKRWCHGYRNRPWQSWRAFLEAAGAEPGEIHTGRWNTRKRAAA